MSTKKGSTTRQRPQKYKNHTAFKNDLHDKTPTMKMINNIQVSQVCAHCKSVIEWKIKYKKYKPLTQQKSCIKCHQRNIKKAYHVICAECSRSLKQCAKCLKSGEEVQIEPAQPTFDEEIKLKAEMDRLIRGLSERKRRTFLRFMDKGKPVEGENETKDRQKLEDESSSEDDVEDDGEDEKNNEEVVSRDIRIRKKPIKNPYSRDELLKKIEELTLGEEEDKEGDDDADYNDTDSDFDFDE